MINIKMKKQKKRKWQHGRKGSYISSYSLGFTLIELMVVIAIMSFISIIGIASYISFNNTQVFNNAYLETKTVLQRAQSLSSSQVIPSVAQCTNTQIQGYQVATCSKTASCQGSCTNNNNQYYTLSVICNGQPVMINQAPYQLPSKTHFTNASCPTFLPLSAGAMPASISIQDSSNTKTVTITVNNTGVIQ